MESLLSKIESYLKNLFNHPVAKIIGAETGVVLQIFTEIRLALLTVLLLVLLDLALGLMAAYRFRCVTSWKLRDTVAKLAFYFSLILISAIVQVAFNVPWIEEAFIGLIVSTELLSILENTEINFPGFIPASIVSKLGVTFHKRKHYKKR
jgi:phage-related holin